MHTSPPNPLPRGNDTPSPVGIPDTPAITGAELACLRHTCGLSRDELAFLCGVQPRTIKHWESGRAAVPADVAQLITRIDATQAEAVQQALAIAQASAGKAADQSHPPAFHVLVRHATPEDLAHHRPELARMPHGLHTGFIARAHAALRAAALPVRVATMHSEEFTAWAKAHGLPDTDHTQAQWAAAHFGQQLNPRPKPP